MGTLHTSLLVPAFPFWGKSSTPFTEQPVLTMGGGSGSHAWGLRSDKNCIARGTWIPAQITFLHQS